MGICKLPRRSSNKRHSRGRRIREKGYLFEDVVAEYFYRKGYSVLRNVRLRGLSGALHEIDILVEKEGMKAVVEVKNYSKPVRKEWIMKIHEVAKDLGIGKAYLVSASGFTEGAERTARMLEVEILSLQDLERELELA